MGATEVLGDPIAEDEPRLPPIHLRQSRTAFDYKEVSHAQDASDVAPHSTTADSAFVVNTDLQRVATKGIVEDVRDCIKPRLRYGCQSMQIPATIAWLVGICKQLSFRNITCPDCRVLSLHNGSTRRAIVFSDTAAQDRLYGIDDLGQG